MIMLLNPWQNHMFIVFRPIFLTRLWNPFLTPSQKHYNFEKHQTSFPNIFKETHKHEHWSVIYGKWRQINVNEHLTITRSWKNINIEARDNIVGLLLFEMLVDVGMVVVFQILVLCSLWTSFHKVNFVWHIR